MLGPSLTETILGAQIEDPVIGQVSGRLDSNHVNRTLKRPQDVSGTEGREAPRRGCLAVLVEWP